jgi:hypothetical protein
MSFALTKLEQEHRFISLNCSLISRSLYANMTLPIRVSTRHSVFRRGRAVESSAIDFHPMKIVFSRNNTKSSSFSLVHVNLRNGGELRVGLTVETDYTNLTGFYFDWDCLNRSAVQFLTTAKLLTAFFTCYVLMVYVFTLSQEHNLTQIMLIVLGIAGIFASDPIGILFGFGHTIVTDVLQSGFIAVYRFFLCMELSVFYPLPTRILFLVTIACALAVSAGIEAVNAFDQFEHILAGRPKKFSLFQRDGVSIVANAIYACVSLIMLESAFVNREQSRRLAVIVGSVVVTDFATLLYVFCVVHNVLMSTVLPMLFVSSTHGLGASLALFLFRAPDGPVYESLDRPDTGETVFKIDHLSEGSDEDEENFASEPNLQ